MSDADPTVLVVDDEDDVRRMLGRLLHREGYGVALAADGASALEAVAGHAPDVVLLDVRMPGDIDGFDVCRRLRSDPATRLLPVVIITGFHARNDRLVGIEAGADDLLMKPFDNDELLARLRSLIRLKRYTDDFDSAASIVMTLASMIEARDGYGDGHCHRMANYATRVGRALGLDEGQVRALYRGAFLHDIGMLTIPEAVLQKPGALDAEEWTLLKSHTIAGDRLCGNLRSLQAVRPIVRHHHERLDGSGYPDGLRGDDVPLLAQVVGIADTFEALTTPRPYQQAVSPEGAFTVLRQHARCDWKREDLVEAFISVVERLHAGDIGGRG
jgi:putative two-component system response regulator